MTGAAASVTCAGGGSTVHIHPQAAPVVCRHVLDTLIQLAKVRFHLFYVLCHLLHHLHSMLRFEVRINKLIVLNSCLFPVPRCSPATLPSSAVRICRCHLLTLSLVFVQSPLGEVV